MSFFRFSDDSDDSLDVVVSNEPSIQVRLSHGSYGQEAQAHGMPSDGYPPNDVPRVPSSPPPPYSLFDETVAFCSPSPTTGVDLQLLSQGHHAQAPRIGACSCPGCIAVDTHFLLSTTSRTHRPTPPHTFPSSPTSTSPPPSTSNSSSHPALTMASRGYVVNSAPSRNIVVHVSKSHHAPTGLGALKVPGLPFPYGRSISNTEAGGNTGGNASGAPLAHSLTTPRRPSSSSTSVTSTLIHALLHPRQTPHISPVERARAMTQIFLGADALAVPCCPISAFLPSQGIELAKEVSARREFEAMAEMERLNETESEREKKMRMEVERRKAQAKKMVVTLMVDGWTRATSYDVHDGDSAVPLATAEAAISANAPSSTNDNVNADANIRTGRSALLDDLLSF